MEQTRYSKSQIAQRAKALYEQGIRAKVEPTYVGQFLALDIESGDYEIDRIDINAINRNRAKHPDAVIYLFRIGYEAAYSIGGGRLPLRKP